MTEIWIDRAALNRVIKKLGSIEHMNMRLRPAMDESLDYMHRRVGRAPRKAAGAFSRMATPAQKRAYWAQVRSGRIGHGAGGYIRTNVTAKKWAKRIEGSANGLTGILGNNAPGAFWVYSRQGQQPFHAASGWPVAEDVLEQSEGAIGRIFARHIKRIIES